MICDACARSPVGRCRSCAQRTPEARARNRQSGIKGGQVSGITRRKYALCTEYERGYQAGFSAGRKARQRDAGGLW